MTSEPVVNCDSDLITQMRQTVPPTGFDYSSMTEELSGLEAFGVWDNRERRDVSYSSTRSRERYYY